MDERVWMGLAAVFGIAAVGLGIWAFTTKSDLNDANDKITKLEQGSAAELAKNSKLAGFDKSESAKYRETRGSLISADKQKADFKNQVSKDSSALTAARKELAAADSAKEKQAAELKVANATSNAAVSCAQATVDAVGAFDRNSGGASNAGRPAERAINQLAGLVGPCKTVLNGSN